VCGRVLTTGVGSGVMHSIAPRMSETVPGLVRQYQGQWDAERTATPSRKRSRTRRQPTPLCCP
jgi:hypothetical protein